MPEQLRTCCAFTKCASAVSGMVRARADRLLPHAGPVVCHGQQGEQDGVGELVKKLCCLGSIAVVTILAKGRFRF